jgi:hypothetical protein
MKRCGTNETGMLLSFGKPCEFADPPGHWPPEREES